MCISTFRLNWFILTYEPIYETFATWGSFPSCSCQVEVYCWAMAVKGKGWASKGCDYGYDEPSGTPNLLRFPHRSHRCLPRATSATFYAPAWNPSQDVPQTKSKAKQTDLKHVLTKGSVFKVGFASLKKPPNNLAKFHGPLQFLVFGRFLLIYCWTLLALYRWCPSEWPSASLSPSRGSSVVTNPGEKGDPRHCFYFPGCDI